MKQFYTVVLDRLASFSGRLDSEPYETGWADELIAFVRVHEKAQCTALRAWLQISPDGIEWIDEFCEWRVYESRREALDLSNGPHRCAASACNRASFEARGEAVLDSTASLRVLQLPHRESDV